MKKEEYRKTCSNLKFIVEGQKMNQKNLYLGFIRLAKQNSKLIDLNKKLNQELEIILKARKRDFEFLFFMKYKDSYVLTSD